MYPKLYSFGLLNDKSVLPCQKTNYLFYYCLAVLKWFSCPVSDLQYNKKPTTIDWKTSYKKSCFDSFNYIETFIILQLWISRIRYLSYSLSDFI